MTWWLKPRFITRFLPSFCGTIADALDLQLLGEALGDADDHVVEQRTGQTMERAVLLFVVGTLDVEDAVLDRR